MDPETTLEIIRSALKNLNEEARDYDEPLATQNLVIVPEYTLDMLTDAWESLDEWLSKGGFLPNDWEEYR